MSAPPRFLVSVIAPMFPRRLLVLACATRPRQHLARAHCATAEDDSTRLGHVSDHAALACQPLASSRHRSEAGGRSTRPRTRCESWCLHPCGLGSTSARRSSLGDDSHPNLKISVPTKALNLSLLPSSQAGSSG